MIDFSSMTDIRLKLLLWRVPSPDAVRESILMLLDESLVCFVPGNRT